MANIGFRTLRNPWLEIERIRSEMERAMGLEAPQGRRAGILPLRISEDAAGVLVEAGLPGVDPESLEILTTGDTLTLKGERERVTEEGIVREHRRERWSGRFARSVNVPGGFDPDGVEATYRHGVLRVRLPRREESLPKKIEVQTAEGA
jgi:HSP20 family protein